MLINIILLILFFIILLWKSKVVEGQSESMVYNILPGFLTDELILYEKEIQDGRPKENILDALDEKGIYKSDEQEEDNDNLDTSICTDSDDRVFFENYDIKSSTSPSTETSINNLNNEKNDILNFNLLGVNFVGDLSNTNTIEENSVNENPSDKTIELCSLVDILYDKNTPMEIKDKISSKHGDCFYKAKFSEKEDFLDISQLSDKCSKSCYKYLKKLPTCNKYILNASKCPDLNASNAKLLGPEQFNMAIKSPNGNVFHNCISPSLETIQSKINNSNEKIDDISFTMNPQMCRFDNVCDPISSAPSGREVGSYDPKTSSCKRHPEKYCEDMYETDGSKTYNCILRPDRIKNIPTNVGACFRDLTPGGLTELCETSDIRNDYQECRIESVPGVFLDPKKVEYAVTIF